LNLVAIFVFGLLGLGSALVFLISIHVVEPGQVAVEGFDVLNRGLRKLDETSGVARLAFAGGSVAVSFISALLLMTRLSGGGGKAGGPPSRYVLVADDQGFVLVETSSIAVIAKQTAMQAPGVVDADVQVLGTGQSVRLRVDLAVHPGADVKRAGSEARDSVHDAVERLVGVEVRDVTVDLRVLDADELARVLL
jgi:uncharacterized alkaline shock family protein YloU